MAKLVAGSAGTRRQPGRREAEGRQGVDEKEVNVGSTERIVSAVAGSILAGLGIARRSLPGFLAAAAGGAIIYRGATGRCSLYRSLGISTSAEGDPRERVAGHGIRIEQAFLINRSPEDLYRYWRNLENLPRIMNHLESVQVIDDRRSKWVAKASRVPGGGQFEWDAEITSDSPNRLIAWRSLPSSQIECEGEVRFAPALGDRGTEVHVSLRYLPPAGRLGHAVAALLGQSPWRLIREDLRNFKRLMEVGEVLTNDGQPRGACLGSGIGKDQS